LKSSALVLPLCAVALFAALTVAQAPDQAPAQPASPQASTATPPPPRDFPAPKNLKVLPKDLTGQQVHEIMEGWAGSLGVHCDTCHAADPNNLAPNGHPRLNFADDSKPQKDKARIMATMTREVNKSYISMIETSAPNVTVTCGTCHRGHLDPPAFVIPEEDHGQHVPPPSVPVQPQSPPHN